MGHSVCLLIYVHCSHFKNTKISYLLAGYFFLFFLFISNASVKKSTLKKGRGYWPEPSRPIIPYWPELSRPIIPYWPEQVPANNFLLAGTVPANNFLLAGTVPANNFLLAGTVSRLIESSWQAKTIVPELGIHLKEEKNDKNFTICKTLNPLWRIWDDQ